MHGVNLLYVIVLKGSACTMPKQYKGVTNSRVLQEYITFQKYLFQATGSTAIQYTTILS